jgi:TonB family protein
MEIVMRSVPLSKTAFLVPLAALTVAAVSPVQANYFHPLDSKLQRNIGSAPSPTAYDMSGVYPAAPVSMASAQKQVAVKVSLSETGTVSGAAVARSSGIARLDDAAVKYVKSSWSYARLSSEALPAEMLLTVGFVRR